VRPRTEPGRVSRHVLARHTPLPALGAVERLEQRPAGRIPAALLPVIGPLRTPRPRLAVPSPRPVQISRRAEPLIVVGRRELPAANGAGPQPVGPPPATALTRLSLAKPDLTGPDWESDEGHPRGSSVRHRLRGVNAGTGAPRVSLHEEVRSACPGPLHAGLPGAVAAAVDRADDPCECPDPAVLTRPRRHPSSPCNVRSSGVASGGGCSSGLARPCQGSGRRSCRGSLARQVVAEVVGVDTKQPADVELG
jgi:hypothetical protein